MLSYILVWQELVVEALSFVKRLRAASFNVPAVVSRHIFVQPLLAVLLHGLRSRWNCSSYSLLTAPITVLLSLCFSPNHRMSYWTYWIGIALIGNRIQYRLRIELIFNHLDHHHQVVLVARISLTLSRHFSLSFIASGRSSGQHPVSSHSCWMCVRAGRPAVARLCVGVHKSASLMSSSLLLQQCPAFLVHLTWIVFVIGGRWPCSWCLVGCCRQGLFNIARSILV